MLPRGASVILGLSGGPDSMALAHILNGLREELGISLHAVHVNHNLRDGGALADQEAVAVWCRSMGIPLTARDADVKGLAAETGESLEMAGREARYAVFADVAESLGATRIALGHNADDNVETVLMNFIRGAGPGGLSGIPPIRELDRGVGDVLVVRPLAEVSRSMIEAYCLEKSLPFRIDPSNDDTVYFRNRIRKVLLPDLEEGYNPAVRTAISQSAGILRDEDAFLDDMASAVAGGISGVWCDGGGIRLDIRGFLGIHRAMQRRVLRLLLRDLGVRPGYGRLEAVRELAAREEGGAVIQVGKGVTCRRFGGWIVLSRQSPGEAGAEGFEADLPIPGSVGIPGNRLIRAEILDDIPENPDAGKDTAYLDADLVGDSLVVRSRRKGDRFIPFGMDKYVKLKDFFNNVKVYPPERSAIPIVECKYGICWISGLRLDMRFRMSQRTGRVLRLTLETLHGSPKQ